MDFDILAALEDRSIEVETLADKDRMQIEYINVNDIVPAKNNSNFYATDEITTLKESIRVEGVKQNLILTYSPCLKAGDSWIQTILAY